MDAQSFLLGGVLVTSLVAFVTVGGITGVAALFYTRRSRSGRH